MDRPFRILGVQQIAVGGLDKGKLAHLFVELLGLTRTGTFESAKENVDEDILRAFIRSLGIYPTGSLVKLASGRLAVVVEQNAGKLTAPRVKVFFSTGTNTQIKPQMLDLGQSGCVDKIVSRESRENWPFTHLEDLWRAEGI